MPLERRPEMPEDDDAEMPSAELRDELVESFTAAFKGAVADTLKEVDKLKPASTWAKMPAWGTA